MAQYKQDYAELTADALPADCIESKPCVSSGSTLVMALLGVPFVQQAITLLLVEVPGMTDYNITSVC